MTCQKPPSEVIDAILLEMAVPHPHLSEAEEAAIKSRLLGIMAEVDGGLCGAAEIAALLRKALADR